MSVTEEKRIGAEVLSPTFSVTSSSSSAASDSDSSSSDGPDVAAEMLDDLERAEIEKSSPMLQGEEDEEEEDKEEDRDEEEGIIELAEHLVPVVFGQALPRSPRSATPLDTEEMEKRAPSTDYPQSQRVYSSPACGISAVLQRQSSDLWMQFDSIGTEMIVTRRGR